MKDSKLKLLDCTLRDGAYVVDAKFGTPAIKGIISKLQDARVDIIECGWLKDKPHEDGTSFYHVPSDLKPYLGHKDKDITYVAMIDWNRYDVSALPPCDHESLDAVRVVFPYGKHREGAEIAKQIRDKGYDIYLQAANTLAYTDDDLVELAKTVNELHPVAISIVDTFGAMYESDLDRITDVLNAHLDPDISMGFHSHNNQQLSFALTSHFAERLIKLGRSCMLDATLCGMGRGAGNTTTELIASYMNRRLSCAYDMNAILDTIDTYMTYFLENYSWGYSTPYFIAGLYCCHVNNIAYLLRNHRTNSRDMRNIIESMSPEDRRLYDYDLLEEKYIENQNRIVDDETDLDKLRGVLAGKEILLVAPGKSIDTDSCRIQTYISDRKPVVIGVNAINPRYEYDFLLFVNSVRYDYAKEVYSDIFDRTPHILLSNIATSPDGDEYIINFNRVVKRGWEHFDNAVITALRLLVHLRAENISIAGFDGFKHKYNESYADASLPTLNPDGKWDELNEEITDMYRDFKETEGKNCRVTFVTESIFNTKEI
ncbi:MAG: aldolase catalytic domain-containing protein [Lachnospiraceae bacterium]|nr:aldolase catalytic domain-containing protein [Lachnospiraceae bacterium]